VAKRPHVEAVIRQHAQPRRRGAGVHRSGGDGDVPGRSTRSARVDAREGWSSCPAPAARLRSLARWTPWL